MRLLDTDIVVDILRGYAPALHWLEFLEEAPGISGFVAMELMQGCRDKREMNHLRMRLECFSIYWPSEADANRALISFSQAHLSHGLGIIDALIGECAVGRDATLCTFNARHFHGIPNLTTEQPYSRKTA